jgi:hypothetical protein
MKQALKRVSQWVRVGLERKLYYWPIQFEYNNDLMGWA